MDLVTIATAGLTPIGDDGPQDHPALLVVWAAGETCCLGITQATVRRLARQGVPFVETPAPGLLREVRHYFIRRGLVTAERIRQAVYGEPAGRVQ